VTDGTTCQNTFGLAVYAIKLCSM